MVAQVQKGSPAARAGLLVGDFVLKVAGEEIRTADGEVVLRRLKEEVGRQVEVGVARPSPVPVTDKEKMKALIFIQTKVFHWLLLLLLLFMTFLPPPTPAGQWNYIPTFW